MAILLQTEKLSRRFDGIVALNDVSLAIEEGSISAVIGPNGAGKTTLFNLCSGVDRPTSGRVLLAGESIGGALPHLIARRGIARTFQNVQLFARLTLLDNVAIGCEASDHGGGFLACMLRLPNVAAREQAARHRALELLELVGLHTRAAELAGNLPFGQQRLLEIARALATQPRLLLLDEPAAGLSGRERAALIDVVRRIRDSGVTVLLVEHDMQLVMSLAEYVAVLNYGEQLAVGTPAEIQNNPQVIAAYLGDEA
jgi:ABC-type branched-subunit amino acid transport system ATPase component